MEERKGRVAEGDKEDKRMRAGWTPGWKVVNIYAGNQWRCFNFNLGLQNIFNVDYRTHGSGINGVSRSVWVSAAYSF